jgi:hypothetical protein
LAEAGTEDISVSTKAMDGVKEKWECKKHQEKSISTTGFY